MRGNPSHAQGFTLIELSIVLVIIGLIVGGVLVGQNLIVAAGVRAQVAQIEKFNTAANTFRGKYGYLPGDIKDPDAGNFGFQARGQYAGEGDGNGVLLGNHNNDSSAADGRDSAGGETVMFWVDLSAAHLIDQTFNTATSISTACATAAMSACFPTAKISNTNYIYVYSGGYYGTSWVSNGVNYFGISSATSLAYNGVANSTPMLTVQQAYAIDSKMDDGFPQSGNVTATYLNMNINPSSITWAAGGGVSGAYSGSAYQPAPTNSATAGSSTTCYDNSSAASGTPGVAGAVQHYSVEISNGANVNCALSFKMQAGD